jgi:hypothetical protein
MGKGSGARPFSVSKEQFGNNFDAIFRKNRNENRQTLTGSDRPTTTVDSGPRESTSTDSSQSRRAIKDDTATATANS